MDKDIRVWLFDIQNSINEIKSYFDDGVVFEHYQKDIKTKTAVERNFEIIGEAVNRITKKDPAFEISDARNVIGLRNQIIHSYDYVSDDLVDYYAASSNLRERD
ncbi:HepT-like ribonuclease domain-containing protein [Chryseobacterium suipulveris]|uniref:HepT-like ribonuclease domain-containing protein n=1 Tax=Chryseobacterium suipulveris TaxID=2929800 RepID=UPI00294FFC10|nr:HepT-like ribonuclease domain-containing protein [Chryseobacterium suipulveris]